MKKLFLPLLLTFFIVSTALAEGPFAVDAALDAYINYFDIADYIGIGTDGTWANVSWSAAITGDDLTAVDLSPNGRALQCAAQSNTATVTEANNDTVLLYDADTTTVLWYAPLSTTEATVNGEVYAFATTNLIELPDIINKP